MTRIVVAAVGTVGDTLPFLAIGSELRRRGHDVQLVSSPAYERRAREASLSFVPVGTVEEYRAFIEDEDLWDPDTLNKTIVKHWLHRIRDYYEAIARLHIPGETVLLSTPGGGFLSVRIAREKFAAPWVVGVIAPSRLQSRFDPRHPARAFPSWSDAVVRSRLGLRALYALKRMARGNDRTLGSQHALFGEVQRIRLSAGLPERGPDPAALAPARVLCMWPSWFSAPQRDWPAGARTTGFPFYPLPDAQGPEGDGSPAVDARPIVFTRGSAASHQRPFFEAAAECCRLIGRKGVLVTPHADDVPRELPGGVTHQSFAPFERIFFGAAAVVHHGGIGTIAYALASGTPQLVVPIIGEQFDLGYRLERLGVGRMLTEMPLTAARLARELESLLRSERIRERCRQLRPLVEPEAGCSQAADVVEELVASSRG